MSRIWLLFSMLALTLAVHAQESEQIPIEHCDRLPVVKISVDKVEMRFLVDSGATTILNLQSFANGKLADIKINSWTGTAATSAREVSIPVLSLGSHQLRNLKLPAIDLSPIGKACGGKIDGLLGVDLMEKMGLTIDFERQLASFKAPPADAKRVYEEMEGAMHPCTVAFERGDAHVFEECLDPEIVLYTPQGEFNGRTEVMKYLTDRYFKFAPNLMYDATLREAKIYGDALWYAYDYVLETPNEHVVGHGMSMCRKSDGHWRILNMHHSLREREPVATTSSR